MPTYKNITYAIIIFAANIDNYTSQVKVTLHEPEFNHYIYGPHEKVRAHVGISLKKMVRIIYKMVLCLATGQLDGREFRTQWPGYSGIALEIGHRPGFSMKSSMYHIKLIMQHIARWLNYVKSDTQLNLLRAYFSHIHTHALRDAHSSRVTSTLACGMAKA